MQVLGRALGQARTGHFEFSWLSRRIAGQTQKPAEMTLALPQTIKATER
jgi:hypothetical protein